jgi:hypothetical protein
MCGYVNLREKYKWRVFEYRVLNKKYGRKREAIEK